jgi:hypothetical protein
LIDVNLINMMSPEQTKIVTVVYDRFISNESRGWDGVDEYLEMLEYLDDDQLHREADVLFSTHKSKSMGCPYRHKDPNACFVKHILEAVEAILDLYKETGQMHKNNRYILANYLALTQSEQIIELVDSKGHDT